MFDTVAIVGATGAVGTIICRLLAERKFPFRQIKFLASGRSAGKTLRFAGRDYTVEELTPAAFDGVDLAIGSTPDEVARDFAPWAVERGCVVVDESGYWRMDPKVPLVVPEVNPDAVADHQGIIASPNCSTTQMVVAMKPLHDAARVRRVVVSTYQATSGMGLAGSRELERGTRRRLAGEAVPARGVRPSDRLQPDSADRLAQAAGLHLGRDEDGLRDAQDPGRRFDPDLPDLRPRAGEQLPQREHPGRDRAEDHGRRGPASCSPPRRASWWSTTWRPRVYPDAARRATAATKCSSAASAKTCRAPTAWRSGASATTCAKAPPPTPCRSPNCWSPKAPERGAREWPPARRRAVAITGWHWRLASAAPARSPHTSTGETPVPPKNPQRRMRTFKLTLAYDGTDYSGWQFQPGRVTLQETLERALAKITGQGGSRRGQRPHRRRGARAGAGRQLSQPTCGWRLTCSHGR